MAVHTAHNPQEFLYWVANAKNGDTIQVSIRDMVDYPFGPQDIIRIDKILTILPENLSLSTWPRFIFNYSEDRPGIEYLHNVNGGRLQQIILCPTRTGISSYGNKCVLTFSGNALVPTKSPSNITIDRVYVDGSLASGGYAVAKGMGGTMQEINTFTGIKIHHLKGIGMHFVSDGFGDGSTISDVEIYELRNSGYGNHGMDIVGARNCSFRNINIHDISDDTTAGFTGIYILGNADNNYANTWEDITVENIYNYSSDTREAVSGINLSGAYARDCQFFRLNIDSIQAAGPKPGYGLIVSDGAHHNRFEDITIANTKTWDIYCGDGAIENTFVAPLNVLASKFHLGGGNHMLILGDKVLKYDSAVSSSQYIFAWTADQDGFITLTVHSDNDGEKGMGWILLDGAQVAYSSTHWWTGGDKNIRANSCTVPVKYNTYITVYAMPSWGAPRYTIWWTPIN